MVVVKTGIQHGNFYFVTGKTFLVQLITVTHGNLLVCSSVKLFGIWNIRYRVGFFFPLRAFSSIMAIASATLNPTSI
jgi:hypothetical protein